jgi:hypothetical protein
LGGFFEKYRFLSFFSPMLQLLSRFLGRSTSWLAEHRSILCFGFTTVISLLSIKYSKKLKRYYAKPIPYGRGKKKKGKVNIGGKDLPS